MNSNQFFSIGNRLRANFIIVVHLMISSTIAQNWIPYRYPNVCNYSTSDKFPDIAVIKTDSFKVLESDTIFYLNTIIADYTIPPYNEQIVLPQFLMKTLRSADNNLYIFEDTSLFVFKIKSSVGDSWIFDSINNITASASAVTFDTILGKTDSLKYIVLSTYDTIVLSKNYGIISFKIPNSDLIYRLIGIENLNLGFHVPGYLDFFNFNIGDIFEYIELYEHNGWSVASRGYRKLHYKFSILEKYLLTNGYKYFIEKYTIEEKTASFTPKEVTYSKSYDSLVYINDTNSFLNYYNHQKYFKYQDTKVDFTNDTIFKVNVKKYDRVPYPVNENAAYGVGVGLIDYYYYEYNWAGGDDRVYIDLIGCKKNNITYGMLSHDSIFDTLNYKPDDIDQMKDLGDDILIYPNPVIDKFTFSSDTSLIAFELIIYNMLGQIVYKRQLNTQINNYTVELTEKLAGVYFVSIISNKGKKVYKIIRQF